MKKLVGAGAVLYGITTKTEVDPIEGVLVDPRALRACAWAARLLDLIRDEGDQDADAERVLRMTWGWVVGDERPPPGGSVGDLATRLEGILASLET